MDADDDDDDDDDDDGANASAVGFDDLAAISSCSCTAVTQPGCPRSGLINDCRSRLGWKGGLVSASLLFFKPGTS